jgi:16S rRNA (cytosine1402-N4)-methyltransferase
MHIPVLKEKLITVLNLQRGDNLIDCTAGEGGHTFAIVEKIAPEGKVLAIDRDKRNTDLIIKKAKELKMKDNVIAVNGNYSDLKKIIKKEEFESISGIVLDLGISNWHIESSGRGFSFQRNEPLDMRFNENDELTAWEIVNSWPPEEIKRILKEYGEEYLAEKIVKAIVERRKKEKINNSLELAQIIQGVVFKRTRINPATKTFQALRIAVNDELNNLYKVLPIALEVLKEGGKIAVISFHSIEDRIVKNFFKKMKAEGELEIETKKPITPDYHEIKNNPKSRSAKLRVAIKTR